MRGGRRANILDTVSHARQEGNAVATAWDDLHAKCRVYTHSETVDWLLDEVGWRRDVNLTDSNLLEPSCGDGAFLVQAVDRLCLSFQERGRQLTFETLESRVCGIEIYPGAAQEARRRIIHVLEGYKVCKKTATRLANVWVRNDDFLLFDFGSRRYSHIIGNPPYVRWSLIPACLRNKYEKKIAKHAAKGDICLAFLHVAVNLLSDAGRMGFLCSDRWLYNAYAEDFRRAFLPRIIILKMEPAHDSPGFDRDVGAYPVRMVVSRRKAGREELPTRETSHLPRSAAVTRYEDWLTKYCTIREVGCVIRVGPALSPEVAFVGRLEELKIEPDLLAPYIGPGEIDQTGIKWRGRYVICMNDAEGQLIDLESYTLTRDHLKKFRNVLEKRAIVRNGGKWYRPIDRVRRDDWTRPKLLVPELTKSPRVVLDVDGFVPSHGIYAIFDPDDDVEKLYHAISGDVLQTTMEAIAPRVGGGAFRCYKRFLERIPLIEDV